MINSLDKTIFRVDKFIVPNIARNEFLDAVKRIHTILKKQPGYIQDFIFEQFSGTGKFNITTIVEWKNLDFIEKAKIGILNIQERDGFHPSEIITRNNIKPDISFCHSILF